MKSSSIIEQQKQLVIDGGLELVENGLTSRTWGNISSRLNESEFLITPSGIPYKCLSVDNIVKVSLNDLSYDGNFKPSSEIELHANVYKQKSNVNFIMHTHQLCATAISIFKDYVNLSDFEDVDYDVVFKDRIIPIAEYKPAGTLELANAVCDKIDMFDDAGVILMANHGVTFFGCSMDECFYLALTLEKTARQIISNVSDKKLPVLPNTLNTIQYEIRNKENSEFAKNIFMANPNYNILAYSKSPHILNVSLIPSNTFCMPAFVDDFSQIAGVNCSFLKSDYNLGQNNMALLKNSGCIALANSTDDVDAICEISEKNALMCLLSEYIIGGVPLSIEIVKETRSDYLSGYSKLASSIK